MFKLADKHASPLLSSDLSRLATRTRLLLAASIFVALAFSVTAGSGSREAFGWSLPVPASFSGLPQQVQLARTRSIVQRFVNDYNARHASALVSLFGKEFEYYDCNFRTSRLKEIYSKAALRRWVQVQFSVGDRLDVAVVSGGYMNNGPSDTVFGLIGTRTNSLIETRGKPPQDLDGSKGILNVAGNRIAFLLLSTGPSCTNS